MRTNLLPEAPLEFKNPVFSKEGTTDVVYEFPNTAYKWVQIGIETKEDRFGQLIHTPIGAYVLDPRLIAADDFTAIDRHCCRVCHRFIRPYNRTYMRDVSSYGSREFYRMDYGNNYCEECAQKLSSKPCGGGIDRNREVTFNREGGMSVTYIASKSWHADPYYDPDALIIESR